MTTQTLTVKDIAEVRDIRGTEIGMVADVLVKGASLPLSIPDTHPLYNELYLIWWQERFGLGELDDEIFVWEMFNCKTAPTHIRIAPKSEIDQHATEDADWLDLKATEAGAIKDGVSSPEWWESIPPAEGL